MPSGPRPEDDRETRARAGDLSTRSVADDRATRARSNDIIPSSSTAKKDTADAVKTGTLAAWREMAQQQDLGGSNMGVGAPSLRYGRGADGQFRRGGHGGGGQNWADTPDAAGHSGSLKGGMAMRAAEAMKYLVEKKGWTPEGAAIAVGNAMQESSVNPGTRPGDPNTPGGSHYMFQWNNGRNNDTVNGRRATFERWARENHRSVLDPEANLDFMDEERKHRSGLEAQWHRMKDLRNAGRLGHLFEGYGDQSEGQRVQNARDLLDLWKKQHPGSEKASTPSPQASIQPLPNLVRLASAAAGGAAISGQNRLGVDPIQLDIHHHQDGRVKSIRAKSGDGVKLNIRSSPTMVSTAVA